MYKTHKWVESTNSKWWFCSNSVSLGDVPPGALATWSGIPFALEGIANA